VLNTELERRIEHRTADLRAERDERRRMEERLRLAVTGAGLGTWHWELATGQLAWSAECLALFGVPPDTPITYERFLACLHADDRVRADAAVRKSLDDRSEYNIELRVIWPDGTERSVLSIGRASYDANGRAVRMEGIAQDVTERKRTSDALQKQSRDLSEQAALLDEAYDPVLIWNLDDGEITSARFAPGVPRDLAHQLGDFARATRP
jgi:PAS domain S-box-containing protein